MPKYVNDDERDVLLQDIANHGDRLVFCNAMPTTFTEANVTFELAKKSGLTSGDYTLAAGDVSGRKFTLAAQTGISVDVQGTTFVAAILDTANSKILAYSNCTQVLVYVGNTINSTVFELELLAVT